MINNFKTLLLFITNCIFICSCSNGLLPKEFDNKEWVTAVNYNWYYEYNSQSSVLKAKTKRNNIILYLDNNTCDTLHFHKVDVNDARSDYKSYADYFVELDNKDKHEYKISLLDKDHSIYKWEYRKYRKEGQYYYDIDSTRSFVVVDREKKDRLADSHELMIKNIINHNYYPIEKRKDGEYWLPKEYDQHLIRFKTNVFEYNTKSYRISNVIEEKRSELGHYISVSFLNRRNALRIYTDSIFGSNNFVFEAIEYEKNDNKQKKREYYLVYASLIDSLMQNIESTNKPYKLRDLFNKKD